MRLAERTSAGALVRRGRDGLSRFRGRERSTGRGGVAGVCPEAELAVEGCVALLVEGLESREALSKEPTEKTRLPGDGTPAGGTAGRGSRQ